MAIRMDGKEVASFHRDRIGRSVAAFTEKTGHRPTLAVVLIGDDPASVSYVTSKKAACEEVGIAHRDWHLPSDTSQEELLDLVAELNGNAEVDGILVQFPTPPQIDDERIMLAIAPEKDVDGLNPVNAGLTLMGRDSLVSCTPKGILAILDYYRIETDGRRVCVIGRSNLVGKPIASLLMQRGRDATVTVCNTHTKNLSSITLESDIIIVAAGHPHTLTADMVKEGAVVIDVGTNRVEDSSRERGWRLVGDADYATVRLKASHITPVPGGVGPMTITMLMDNTLIAAERRAGVKA